MSKAGLNGTEPSVPARTRQVRVGVTALRGVFAFVLGLAMLLGQDSVGPRLGHYIGMYLFSDGLAALRLSHGWDRKDPLPGIGGALGVLTGVAALGRAVLDAVVPSVEALQIVGLLALLTGWTRVLNGLSSTGAASGARDDESTPVPMDAFRRAESCLLGGFELLLGGVLAVTAPEIGDAARVAALTPIMIGWALVAAATLFTDAWRQHVAAVTAHADGGERHQRTGL